MRRSQQQQRFRPQSAFFPSEKADRFWSAPMSSNTWSFQRLWGGMSGVLTLDRSLGSKMEIPGRIGMDEFRAEAEALLRVRRFGILSTHSEAALGYPFGSLASYAVDDEVPTCYISLDYVRQQRLSSCQSLESLDRFHDDSCFFRWCSGSWRIIKL